MKWKLLFYTCLMCVACKNKPRAIAAVTHLVSAHQPGALLYLDRLDNRAVLQWADTIGKTSFCSFLIGLRDSVAAPDAKKRLERERYFQYTMQEDWAAMVDGDALRPVFFQQKPGLDPQLDEEAMVFEIPRGHRVDTLVYRDSYGGWGTQIFVLNGK